MAAPDDFADPIDFGDADEIGAFDMPQRTLFVTETLIERIVLYTPSKRSTSRWPGN
jgi:hypothetical protein